MITWPFCRKVTLLNHPLVYIYLKDDTRFLKEIGPHFGTNDVVVRVEDNLNILAKSTVTNGT